MAATAHPLSSIKSLAKREQSAPLQESTTTTKSLVPTTAFAVGQNSSPLRLNMTQALAWPSFWAPSKEENVATKRDLSHFMVRTEVLCAACDAHLGP